MTKGTGNKYINEARQIIVFHYGRDYVGMPDDEVISTVGLVMRHVESGQAHEIEKQIYRDLMAQNLLPK